MSEFTLEQWIEALDAKRHGSQFRAPCPLHDPEGAGKPDLDIAKKNGRIVCTCRVCGVESQNEVYEAARSVVAAHFNGSFPTVRATASKRPKAASAQSTTRSIKDISPLDWYSEYTKVPRKVWEGLGVAEEDRYVLFEFPGVDARKKRKRGTREFEWVGLEAPPLWPMPEETLPASIALVEGESDCGILRHLGFHAFATTKGARATGEGGVNADLLRVLKERGVESVLIFSDADSSGAGFRSAAVRSAQTVGLDCAYVDLAPHCDPTRGEKDARALYLRYGKKAFLALVKEATVAVEQRPYVDALSDVLIWADEDEGWLIEDLVARGTKTLVTAPAKSLKTYFMLHLVACCSTCSPLLGVDRWHISQALRVLLVEEEGSRQMFGHRVKRVLNGIDSEVQERPQFRFRRGFNLLDHAQVTALIEHAGDDEIDLVILDPFQRITPGIDENSNSDMRRAWDAVNRILLELPHLAVIVVMHTRKGDDLSFDANRGAVISAGEVDLGVFLKKNADFTRTESTYQGTLALTLDGREHPQEYTKEGGAMEVEYLFDHASDAFTMHATGDMIVTVRATSKQKGIANKEDVFEVVRALYETTSQGQTKDEVCEAVGLAPRTVEKHLARLTEEGRLKRSEIPKTTGGVKAIWEVVRVP